MGPSLKLSRRFPQLGSNRVTFLPREARRLRVALAFVTFVPVLLAASACARLGFSNRVLHDVPSPDGQYRAVCQEVLVFDGPEYQTRLHRADGTFVANLAYGNDAFPCAEVVWSPDGSRLAVLSTHVALATIVDAAGASGGAPSERTPNREVSLTWPQGMARNLRFASNAVLEFDACDGANVANRPRSCTVAYERRRLDVSVTPARGVPLPR